MQTSKYREVSIFLELGDGVALTAILRGQADFRSTSSSTLPSLPLLLLLLLWDYRFRMLASDRS
jgi:hypothetical protein